MIASDEAIFSIDKIILNAKLLIETRWPNWSNDKPQWRKLYRKKKENLQSLSPPFLKTLPHFQCVMVSSQDEILED